MFSGGYVVTCGSLFIRAPQASARRSRLPLPELCRRIIDIAETILASRFELFCRIFNFKKKKLKLEISV